MVMHPYNQEVCCSKQMINTNFISFDTFNQIPTTPNKTY